MTSETPLPESTALATLPRTGDIEQWTSAEKGLAEFVGFTQTSNGVTTIAPRGVREAYLLAVERTQLDPIARQLYLAFIGGKWLIIVGIDGFRLIAQRSKEYRGQDAAQWISADPEDTVWRDVWTRDEAPGAARVGVYRKGFKKAVVGIATWKAYGKTGAKSGQWDKNGPHMLAIRAEAQALRKAFPLELSGLYTIEEFDRDAVNENEIETRDWAGEVATTNLLGIGPLYTELRESTEWSPKLDAIFRARRSALMREKEEADEAKATITVNEGVPADA